MVLIEVSNSEGVVGGEVKGWVAVEEEECWE